MKRFRPDRRGPRGPREPHAAHGFRDPRDPRDPRGHHDPRAPRDPHEPPHFGGPPWVDSHWGHRLHRHIHHHHAHFRQLQEDIHEHRRLRQRWRRFSGASLRRRLFLWFGATIFVTILVNSTLARLSQSGRWHHIPPAVFVIVPLMVLWGASGKVARRIARPLDALVGVAQDIGAGNLSARARLHWAGIDEIAELSRAINDMAERIERQLGDQRELMAGVSHEIRTPLARLRVLIEIARDQGANAINLNDLEREVLDIDALVGELLASARLDFSALTPMSLDANEVAERAVSRAGLPADMLLAANAAHTRFVGDPTLLSRALANLLRNATVHGGGAERVVVTATANDVSFAVLDRGPGFPVGEEQRVFERFYRPQRSDPETSGADGSHAEAAAGLGLGLALVHRIAIAHGGSATARNRLGGGAEVVLLVPRTPRQGNVNGPIDSRQARR